MSLLSTTVQHHMRLYYLLSMFSSENFFWKYCCACMTINSPHAHYAWQAENVNNLTQLEILESSYLVQITKSQPGKEWSMRKIQIGSIDNTSSGRTLPKGTLFCQRLLEVLAPVWWPIQIAHHPCLDAWSWIQLDAEQTVTGDIIITKKWIMTF